MIGLTGYETPDEPDFEGECYEECPAEGIEKDVMVVRSGAFVSYFCECGHEWSEIVSLVPEP
jgi:hypothetical protein